MRSARIADLFIKVTDQGDTGMDAIILSELEKIIASLDVIENQLMKIDVCKARQSAQAETHTEFPSMPFPGFDDNSFSLPI